MRLGSSRGSRSGREFSALESRCIITALFFQAALAFIPVTPRPPVPVLKQLQHQPPVLKMNRFYCKQTRPTAGRDVLAVSGWGAGEGAGGGCQYRLGRSRVMPLGFTLRLASASSDNMLEDTAKVRRTIISVMYLLTAHMKHVIGRY